MTESKIIPPHRIKKGREIIDGLVYEFENIKDGEHIDQLIIKLPELKTIIVQDLVSNHAHAFVGGGRLDEWIKILERLAAMENYDAVLVGHGGPAKRSVYGQMIEYLSHAKSVLAASTGGEQITKGLIDKYPDHGARTLAELSGWFTDFMRRRQ